MKHLLLSSALFAAILCVTPVKAMDYIDDEGIIYKPYKRTPDFVPSLKEAENFRLEVERLGGKPQDVSRNLTFLKEELINFKRDGDIIRFEIQEVYKGSNGSKTTYLGPNRHQFINLQNLSLSEKLKLLVLKKLN